MNTRERHIIRSLRDQSRRLTTTELSDAALQHVTREIHDVLTLLTDAEQPYEKEYRCYDQAESRLGALENYLTRCLR